MSKRRIAVCLLALAMAAVLSAGLFKPIGVAVDTKEKKVYRYYSAEYVSGELSSNLKGNKPIFDGEYLCLVGKVTSVKSNGKSFTLQGNDKKILCSAGVLDDSMRENIKMLAVGQEVAVYGEFNVDPVDNDLRVTVDRVAKVPGGIRSTEQYFLSDETNICKEDMKFKTLGKHTVQFFVPESWETVEHDIKGEGIGTLEGYQYALNQLSYGGGSDAESFFVTYFDCKEFVSNPGDIADTEAVEMAIIQNISGKVGKFPTKTVKTYYDTEYKYYLTSYSDGVQIAGNYRAEYIFQKVSDDGIVMYLYIYRGEPKHLDDVMFVTRLLNVMK